MPTTAEFLATLLLAAAYAASTLGFYAILRRGPFSRPLALALSVPLCQAFYSFLFQLRFLFGMGAVGDGLAWLAAVALAVAAATRITEIRHDLADLARLGLRYRWAGVPLLVAASYGAIQVLLFPPLNLDGIAYHLPRVFLFQQSESLFLEHFSSYHQAVFPVGGDLLFHPFLALGTDHGLGIFSLGSYLAVGAAAYSIARKLTSRGRAVLAALSILCLDLIVLQSVTIKNDILVAAVAGSSLALALEIRAARQVRRLLLLALLCAYGLSIKLTFLAFIPGLAALVFIRLRLWETARIRDLSGSLRRDLRLCLAALPVILVFSQVWLFAFNTHHYGSWNGPPEFTHRHGQHDGALGAAANLLRYGMQAAQFGYVTDRYLAERIGLPRPTAKGGTRTEPVTVRHPGDHNHDG